ncbi:hypothetical protein R3P38DRAFT_2844306 [Favolaschia claudopus]|uniref:Ketoreductase (KR) domain-containing protein n=1 Tax=Favolaschia claudopus TaxID=2862362 RepID=A0AAW0E321_9AGAR
MVLKMLAAAADRFPREYTAHVVAALIALLATRRISQGRQTTRERDMHGRVVVLTGAFTPVGLTLLENLAQRGAHVIALTPRPVDSEHVSTYIDLLRSTTSNENIYAERCDLASPSSIHQFAARFSSGGAGEEGHRLPTAPDPRIDALVCAHEYPTIGALALFSSKRGKAKEEEEEGEQRTRDENALATFLLITLLLPMMLTAPVERDIRIVNVVNRFYPAAAPGFFKAEGAYAFSSVSRPPLSASASAPTSSSTLLLPEATRALRTVLLTRHLQRILDALPSAPVPSTSSSSKTTSTSSSQKQKSNIVAVSVSPGLSRSETVAPLFGGSLFGRIIYLLLYPLLLLLTKSANASVQSVLHVLFLPTPFKSYQNSTTLHLCDFAAMRGGGRSRWCWSWCPLGAGAASSVDSRPALVGIGVSGQLGGVRRCRCR